MMKKLTLKLSALALLAGTAACGEQQEQTSAVPNTDTQYSVEVKRTSYGIPHITADDYGSLGYGEGFAAAQDHVCNIAQSIMQSQGNYSKYYGAGENNQHLMQDIAVRQLDIPARASELFVAQEADIQEWFTGFAAGYNRYVIETGTEGITAWCKGADWVRTITPEELLTRALTIAHSTARMGGMIASATPPKAENTGDTSTIPSNVSQNIYAAALDGLAMKGMGSNGWAIGKDRTENGKGMLLGNPHYPWLGTNRFWEKHLTIPGEMNLYGSHLVGLPGVAIGFNENIGWTHTVSNSKRVVFYKLDLVPGDPTSYLYDGEVRQMTSRTLAVPVLGEDGTTTSQEHTVWFSHYGPIVNMPGMEWSAATAFTIRDANAQNIHGASQWKDMGLAKSMDEFIAVHDKWNAMPWVNTIATSEDGQAVYLDGSNVGNLSEEAIAFWQESIKTDPLSKGLYERAGIVLLNGSDSRFEWQSHPDERLPGVVPFAEKPQQNRSDYVFNANDSYWLTNAAAPMTGHSPLYGQVESGRSLRTRMNAILLSDTSADGAYGADGKLSLHEMQQALFLNRSLAAELLKDDLVAACTAENTVTIDDQQIDLSKACEVLAAYNGRLDLEANGAVLFREWITSYDYRQSMLTKSALFAVPFDPADPVHTPRGLADTSLALEKLGHAVLTLQKAGLALDSQLADAQFAYRQGEKISVHGGNSHEGVANLIDSRPSDVRVPQTDGTPIEGSIFLTDKGYLVRGGSSFILSLNYTENGPVAEALLTYSQSGDATSPHFTDQTKLFAKKEWRPVLYKTEDINRDVKSTLRLTGER